MFNDKMFWIPSRDRGERLKERWLPSPEFAALTGANHNFSPSQLAEWMLFWKTDICEQDEFRSSFPRLSLPEAQRVWLEMERLYFARYDYFLRVWPEWYSSGVWMPPYPGSRTVGGMLTHDGLPLSQDLVRRFNDWQDLYNDSPPCGPNKIDWDRFDAAGEDLARDLKRCVGERVYVEYDCLVEILMDGTTRSCRPLLGLPEAEE